MLSYRGAMRRPGWSTSLKPCSWRSWWGTSPRSYWTLASLPSRGFLSQRVQLVTSWKRRAPSWNACRRPTPPQTVLGTRCYPVIQPSCFCFLFLLYVNVLKSQVSNVSALSGTLLQSFVAQGFGSGVRPALPDMPSPRSLTAVSWGLET
jgi:hypothetical protein